MESASAPRITAGSFLVMLVLLGCSPSPPEQALELADRLISPRETDPSPANLTSSMDTPTVSDQVSVDSLELGNRLLRRVGNTKLTMGVNPSPLRIQNLVRLVQRYQELGMWNHAAREVRKLVQAQPGNARWNLMKGRIHARLARVRPKHRSIALESLRTAEEFPRTRRPARVLLAMMHGFQLGNPERARSLLEGLTTDDFRAEPVEIQARFALSRLHYQSGRIIEAARVLQPMVEEPRLGERHRVKALRNLGQLYRRLGSPNTARQYLRRAYKLQPWNSEIRSMLSRLGDRPRDRYRRFE